MASFGQSWIIIIIEQLPMMWDMCLSGCSSGHTRVVVAALKHCRILQIRSDNCFICCRSLTYHFDRDLPWHEYLPPFPLIDQMVGLTYLRMIYPHWKYPVSLESLHNLKEYVLYESELLPEIVISSAAELTKLSVKCRLRKVFSRHHVKHPQVIITYGSLFSQTSLSRNKVY